MEKDIYLPEKFWNRLVLGQSLEEVGHSDMGRAFNTWAYTLRQRALVQGLQSAKHYPPPAPIFEAGFGVGYYLKLWHSLGIKPVSGMDLSAPACRRVREHFPEYELRQGDLFELDRQGDWPRFKGQFSLVTLIDVLYHVMDDARAAHVLELLAQLVAPGGIMVFTEKFPRGGHPADGDY